MRRAAVVVVLLGSALGACRACSREDGTTSSDASSAPGDAAVVAESLPRCRAGAERIAISGEDVVVGDVAIGSSALYAGVIRVEGEKRIASVLRAPLDLSSSKLIDVGVSFGDDPPPSPRISGGNAWVAFYTRRSGDAGPRLRELEIARLEDGALGKVEGTVLQQADESTAFDVAWNEAGAGLVAWDEDAPPSADAGTPDGRGFVKVQALGSGARRIASPDSSDAESPRLLARPGGGFWLAWLARRVEEEAWALEGPGEQRAFRWVEVVPLTATGEPAGPVRRVSSEKGRAAAFELGRSAEDLVVLVQDETAPSEGGGARIVRHLVRGNVESVDLVDAGVGSAVAELVPAPAIDVTDGGARWLAFTDTAERVHLAPLGRGLFAAARSTLEPAFDGARVVASVPPEHLYALVVGAPREGAPREAARPELRRFTCSLESPKDAPGDAGGK